MASSTTTTQSARAIVASAPGAAADHHGGKNWKLVQDLTVRPLKDDEVLVRMAATGICHTDFVVTSIPAEYGAGIGITYPMVVGHEGSLLPFLPISMICWSYAVLPFSETSAASQT